jgi:hypothetical protein
MMGKLHEILAIDRDRETVANKIITEAINTFTKKQTHFVGMNKRLEMFDDARQKEADGQKETTEMVTTVDDKLKYVMESWVTHIDVLAQKERTNQEARADVVLPTGDILLVNIPATLLLGLETKLAALRTMYDTVPTLQPGIKWVSDSLAGAGVFVAAEDEVKNKTEQSIGFKVLVPATDKHPAQVEKWIEQVPIGKYITERRSGMLSPARKSDLLERIDTLITSVKQARMRANNTEVVPISVGKVIAEYINAQ